MSFQLPSSLVDWMVIQSKKVNSDGETSWDLLVYFFLFKILAQRNTLNVKRLEIAFDR